MADTIDRPALGTRAVTRLVQAGNSVMCESCGGWLKFHSKRKTRQVICNVYVGGRWDRVEHFHPTCYEAEGQPHGVPDASDNRWQHVK